MLSKASSWSAPDVVREIARHDGSRAISRWSVGSPLATEVRQGRATLADAAPESLYSTRPPLANPQQRRLAIVDFFAGVGGLSLCVVESDRSLGHDAQLALAVDVDAMALAVLQASDPDAQTVRAGAWTLLPDQLGDPLGPGERALKGPPAARSTFS